VERTKSCVEWYFPLRNLWLDTLHLKLIVIIRINKHHHFNVGGSRIEVKGGRRWKRQGQWWAISFSYHRIVIWVSLMTTQVVEVVSVRTEINGGLKRLTSDIFTTLFFPFTQIQTVIRIRHCHHCRIRGEIDVVDLGRGRTALEGVDLTQKIAPSPSLPDLSGSSLRTFRC